MTFHEMERHVCRSESIDGDIIGVGTEDGPLQLHEAHAVQTSTKIESTFLGVTRDQYGKRTQYHVRYDLNQFATKSESIPIDVRNAEGVRQLFHVYNPKRISATRGVTQLAPVFSLSGMLEDINFAKLVQQQAVSCFAILSEKAVGSNGNLPNVDRQSKFGEPSTEQTGSGVRNLEGVSPGMFYDGREGEKLTGFSPNIPNSEYFQQVKLILQIVGVNFGLPLCLILMDGSETNFSGWRGAVDEARKGFVADQLNLVRRWHSPVYRWWLHREMAMEPILQRAAERQGIDIFGHAWQLPTWSYIEPVADAEGDTAQLRNALTSPRRMHAARGKDWETIAEEIIDDNVYAIAKAQAKADSHNQKFPKAPPLSWRDLIPLPMPEGQTLAMQDPAAIAVQEEAANTKGAEAENPQAKAKRTPRAAKDGKWRTTDDGGKMFISDDGDVNFGGPGGEPAKEAAPPKNPTHNIKLPKDKKRLTIDQANSALKGMGITPGKIETKLNPQTKKFETSQEVTMPDGTKVKKTSLEVTKLVYEGADDFVPKKKVKAVASERDFKRDDDGKFATDGGGGGGKSTGAKSADLALPEPKIKVSAKSARQMEEMIREDLQQGKTLEESFAQYDDGGWDYLEFAGKKNAIANVERALDKHDAKSGSEPGATDEIDGQHWEDWISDNYTSPVEDKLINEFKEQMRAKFGKQS
jgi:capsid protein